MHSLVPASPHIAGGRSVKCMQYKYETEILALSLYSSCVRKVTAHDATAAIQCNTVCPRVNYTETSGTGNPVISRCIDTPTKQCALFPQHALLLQWYLLAGHR